MRTINHLHILSDVIPVKVWRDEIECILLLGDGAKVEWTVGGKTEEGYDRETFSYSRIGDTIRRDYYRDASDCDGRIISSSEEFWTESDGVDYMGYPNWKEETSSNRDYSAEAMGY